MKTKTFLRLMKDKTVRQIIKDLYEQEKHCITEIKEEQWEMYFPYEAVIMLEKLINEYRNKYPEAHEKIINSSAHIQLKELHEKLRAEAKLNATTESTR